MEALSFQRNGGASMLVLKIQKGERVKLFYDGKEVGEVGFDRPDRSNPNAVRLVFDCVPEVKIYRDKVIEKSEDLRANLTFRNEWA